MPGAPCLAFETWESTNLNPPPAPQPQFSLALAVPCPAPPASHPATPKQNTHRDTTGKAARTPLQPSHPAPLSATAGPPPPAPLQSSCKPAQPAAQKSRSPNSSELPSVPAQACSAHSHTPDSAL